MPEPTPTPVIPPPPGAGSGQSDTFGKNPKYDLPTGWVINRQTGRLIPPGSASEQGGQGIGIGELFDVGGTVYRFNGRTLTQASLTDARAYWNAGGNISVDAEGAHPTTEADFGAALGGAGQRLTSDDPRYWDVQYRQLEQELLNSGLDAESARRQALATIIANRNNAAVNLAQTSGQIAEAGAKFAANPRDPYSDILYRNAVGGQNLYEPGTAEFGQLQQGLENRFQELFGGVAGDLSRAREYVGAPIPSEYLSPQLNIPRPSFDTGQGAAANPAGGGVPAPVFDAGQGGGVTRQQGTDYAANLAQQAYATNPKENVDEFFRRITELNRGVPPTTAEAGVNMNIMEPAMVVGKSGRVYATLAEGDPEQLIVKPLPSVMERKKKEKDSAKDFVKATEGVQRLAQGGTIAAAIPNYGDLMEQIRKLLSGLGGGGAAGVGDFQGTYPHPRLLAGAPARQLAEDPRLQDYAYAAYSTKEGGGLDPRDVDAIIKRYTPQDSRYQNRPTVSFA